MAAGRAAVVVKRTSWPLVWLAIGAGVASGLQLGKVPPALPQIRADLGLGLVAAGWVASMFSLCGALLGLAAGVFIERLGRWRALALAMIATALGSAAGGLAGSAATLLAGRFVEGIGFVLVAVGAPGVIIAETAPGERSLALGLWGIYLPLGAAAGLLGAPLVLAPFGFRVLWLANAGLCGLLACALAALARRDRVRPAPEPWRAGLGYLRDPVPWAYALAFTLYTAQYHAVLTWLPTYLVERHALGLGAASLAGALVVVMSAAGSVLGGWVMHRNIPRRRVLVAGFAVLAACGAAVFAAALPVAAKIAAGVAFSTAGGMIAAACISGAPSRAVSPLEVGAGNGMAVQGANLGSLLGPPALAAVVTAGGWVNGPWFMLAAGAAGVALALAARRLATLDARG